MQHIDLIIVGQGITGSCLAWWADQSQLKYHVLDSDEAATSSKIAAGMMTPVTGKKLVLSQEFVDNWEPATAFYHQLEEIFQQQFVVELPMIRLIADETELAFYHKRQSPIYNQYAQPYTGQLNSLIDPCAGTLLLKPGGRLIMDSLCQQIKTWLKNRNALTNTTVSWSEDFLVTHEEVIWKPGNLAARNVIFCDGAGYQLSSFFPEYQLTPSKGEILTLHIPDLQESHIILHHTWLLPLGNDLYKFGATYEWDDLTNIPTEQGKQKLLSDLALWMKAPVTVVDHVAAVRPTPKQFRTFAGWSTREPKLGMINGLGSKGSLIAPELTKSFLKDWCERQSLTRN